jgi:hypothetical protein
LTGTFSLKKVPGEIFEIFVEKRGTKEFLSKRYRNRPKEGKASGEKIQKIPKRIFLVTGETEARKMREMRACLKGNFVIK